MSRHFAARSEQRRPAPPLPATAHRSQARPRRPPRCQAWCLQRGAHAASWCCWETAAWARAAWSSASAGARVGLDSACLLGWAERSLLLMPGCICRAAAARQWLLPARPHLLCPGAHLLLAGGPSTQTQRLQWEQPSLHAPWPCLAALPSSWKYGTQLGRSGSRAWRRCTIVEQQPRQSCSTSPARSRCGERRCGGAWCQACSRRLLYSSMAAVALCCPCFTCCCADLRPSHS